LVAASWITLKSSARSRLLTAFTLGALSLGLCTPALGQAIVVGAKEFTEQLLVAEMSVQLLRAHGFNAHKGTGFATTGVRTLQESGIVDLYWEYTGTSLTTFNHVTEKLSPDEGYERVKALDAHRGLVWLSPSKVNNTYALAMRRADAAERRIRSISDLAAKVREGEGIKLASTLEFLSRTDGLQPLQQTYGFKFTLGNVVGMDTGAIYNALRRGFDVGVVFATDGRISAFDLTVLRDDQGFFPSYLLTPVMRQATLNRYPALKPILEALSAQLDNETMVALNSAVDLEGRKLEDVASEFVRSRGLVEKP
jgi:osmoprotectant transport system substrate-binding protein